VWLGAGFWTALSALIVLLVVFARRTGWRLAPATACAAVAVAIIAAFAAGGLDTLSLAVEIRARGDLIAPAVVRHAMLSLGSLALALALAVPLAWSAFRWRSVEAVASAGLQAVQVVPAIALLAALVPILSLVLGAMPALRQLGMAAIGPAPAVIGVGAYLALPLVSSILAALRSADPAVVDAARGMGMSEGRITRDVRLPLGVPILVGGLRLGMVQSIGLSTLGGLIGAGGLGGIVFEGMAQFASDLILLGAAPIVVMAMTVDFGLRALEVRLATAMGGARE
jgi:osmoprotectant transport system permease protein